MTTTTFQLCTAVHVPSAEKAYLADKGMDTYKPTSCAVYCPFSSRWTLHLELSERPIEVGVNVEKSAGKEKEQAASPAPPQTEMWFGAFLHWNSVPEDTKIVLCEVFPVDKAGRQVKKLAKRFSEYMISAEERMEFGHGWPNLISMKQAKDFVDPAGLFQVMAVVQVEVGSPWPNPLGTMVLLTEVDVRERQLSLNYLGVFDKDLFCEDGFTDCLVVSEVEKDKDVECVDFFAHRAILASRSEKLRGLVKQSPMPIPAGGESETDASSVFTPTSDSSVDSTQTQASLKKGSTRKITMITVLNFSPVDVRNFLLVIYSPQTLTGFTAAELTSVYPLLVKYGVDHSPSDLLRILKTKVSAETACTILPFAHANKLEPLMERCLALCGSLPPSVWDTEEWQGFAQQHPALMLKVASRLSDKRAVADKGKP